MYLSLKDKNLFSKIKNIHFIGISGVSMNSLASFLLDKYPTINITGSTNQLNFKLRNVKINHGTDHLNPEDSLVVYTSCLGAKHEDMKNILVEKKILVIHRSILLNLITNNNNRILVTGAHGKTSTSVYLYQLLKEKDYGCFVGASLPDNTNYKTGTNYVVEGDESDGSFVNIQPNKYIIITNISNDHINNYNNSFEEYLYTFESNLFHKNDSLLIYNKNIFNPLSSSIDLEYSSNCYLLDLLVQRTRIKNISYGIENSDVNIEIIQATSHLEWKLKTQHKDLTKELDNRVFVCDISGVWNIYNITASLIVATLESIKTNNLLDLFKPKRRMEVIYKSPDLTIIDDYAVHPKEIDLVIDLAIKKYGLNNILFVWEPHRPSRIRALHSSFADVFEKVQANLLVTEVYNANESPILTDEEYDFFIKYGKKKTNLEYIENRIKKNKENVVVLLSAGDLSINIHNVINNLRKDNDV